MVYRRVFAVVLLAAPGAFAAAGFDKPYAVVSAARMARPSRRWTA